MTSTKHTNRPTGNRLAALLLSASGLALSAAPASAQDVVFSDNGTGSVSVGQRTAQSGGVTQLRLQDGVMLSFVDNAEYTIRADGAVDLHSGSVTVAGADGAAGVIRMPDGTQARVSGTGSAGSFSVDANGQGRGQTLTGVVTVTRGRDERAFEAGEHWASSGRNGLRQVVSNGAQATPSARRAAVARMDRGGPVAAAQNGLPVSLGDALAAAGASSDILGAARRVEAAAANPRLETFPSGDLSLLVAAAGRLERAYGGTPFPQAQADIIRAYIGYLADGGSGAEFLTAYAGFVSQYLDLLRSGALPSGFAAARVSDINAFLAYQSRLGALGGLAAQDRALVDAYLAFLAGGGEVDGFTGRFTTLVEAYFAFVRAGGDPADFSGGSAELVNDYIAFLNDSGLLVQLSEANRALLAAYLANGGLGFVGDYRAALDAYFAYLAAGNLPSDFDAQDAETLQAYLEALQAAGLFDTLPGAQADFFARYLAFVQGGGEPDAFAGLNANIFADYATQLQAYYNYLLSGGIPSAYEALTQQQIAAYVAALQTAGATGAFLPELGAFYAGYAEFLASGGNPDIYTGLPVLNLPVFADALNAYAAFLANGGLPSDFSATDLDVLANYLAALQQSGQLASLLGANADLLSGYFAYLAGGGNVDQFAGLPIYADYVSALEAYYAFLDNGGLPGDYTALTAQQIEDYLAALASAGGLASQLGDLGTFYTRYFAFLSAGGDPADFAGLPVYVDYLAAIDAFYAYLLNGGLPSGYTALTADQIEAYLAALADAGILTATYSGEQLTFFNTFLAYLAAGGNADQFAGLPNGSAPELYGINAWAFGVDGLRINSTSDAEITADGRITRVSLNSTAGNQVFDYSARTADLREFGRIGNAVAWSRYYVGSGPSGSNISEHLLVGMPAINMPTSGIVSYSLIGGTAPTDRRDTAGSTAYFTGELGVAFGGAAPLVGVNFDVLTGTEGYRVQTPGGAANPLEGGMGVDANGQFENQSLAITNLTATTCNGYCQAQVFGGLFGVGASNAGFTYNIFDREANNAVQGVAVFGTDGTPVAGLGTPPPVADVTLPNQSIAFANKLIGDDVHTLSDVTYNADGIPVGYEASLDPNEALTSGDMVLADTGTAGSGTLSWARWSDGTPGGNWYNQTLQSVGPNGGYHVIAGAPLTNMPARGAVAYDLIGFTTPTRHEESTSTGSVSGGAAVVFGASPVVALDLDITSGPDSFNLYTAGKLTDPEQSTLAINPLDGMFHTLGVVNGFAGSDNAVFVDSASTFCGSTCTGFVEGFLAGEGASHMGLAYSIRANSTPSQFIDGTAAFAAGDAIDLGGGSGGGTSGFTGTRDGIVYYTYFEGSFASGFGGSADLVDGELTKFTSVLGTVDVASANIVEAGDLGDMAWARWTGGTVETRTIVGDVDSVVGANGGYHVMAGTPTVNLPAGTIAYELIGGTSATDNRGSTPGSLTGDLAIDFASLGVGYDLSMEVGGMGWAVSTNGGAANPSASQFAISIGSGGWTFGGLFSSTANTVTATGNACAATCIVNVSGTLYGAGADHVALAMNVTDSSAANGTIGASGLAIFGQEGANAAQTPDEASAWARWEVPVDGSPAAGAAGMVAPGIDTIAGMGIQYSADQLAQLEAYLSQQMN